eukprot:15329446-Ditylum_brightwellii.AAC.1
MAADVEGTPIHMCMVSTALIFQTSNEYHQLHASEDPLCGIYHKNWCRDLDRCELDLDIKTT